MAIPPYDNQLGCYNGFADEQRMMYERQKAMQMQYMAQRNMGMPLSAQAYQDEIDKPAAAPKPMFNPKLLLITLE